MRSLLLVSTLFLASVLVAGVEAAEPPAKAKAGDNPQNAEVVKASDDVLAKVEALKKSLEQTRAKAQKGELKVNDQSTSMLLKRMSMMNTRLESWTSMVDTFRETGEIKPAGRRPGAR